MLINTFEITTSVNSDLLNKSEKEIFEILLNQHLSYSNRWYSNLFVTKVVPALRIVGLIGSLLGIGLCVYIIINKPEWCPAWANINLYTLTFFLLFILFYFFPRIHNFIVNWNRGYAYKNCKKIAAKCVRQARNQVPYIAEYKIDNDKITYYRVKDEVSKKEWTRKLKGVSFQGNNATVFFRKWTSFIPKIVILHEDIEPIKKALNNAQIEVKSIIKS